jgi:hypothetical protein
MILLCKNCQDLLRFQSINCIGGGVSIEVVTVSCRVAVNFGSRGCVFGAKVVVRCISAFPLRVTWEMYLFSTYKFSYLT